jgi:hypothetical protein
MSISRLNKDILDSRYLAFNESKKSMLPGRQDGPADAYRHFLVAAELTRRIGPDGARLGLSSLELYGRW